MAAEILNVKITKRPENPSLCNADPSFVAKRGSVVVFDFDQEPNADLVFQGESPFDKENKPFKPGKMTVRADATQKRFTYDVIWRGAGKGNGTGEIIP